MALDEKLKKTVDNLTDDDRLAGLATRGLISGAKGMYRGASWIGQKFARNSVIDDSNTMDLPERPKRDTGSDTGFAGSQENWTWLKDVLSNIASDISSIKQHLVEQDKERNSEGDFEKLKLVENELENRDKKQKGTLVLEKKEEKSSGLGWLALLLPLGFVFAGALKELLKSFPQIEDAISNFSKKAEEFLKNLPGVPDDFTAMTRTPTTIKTPKGTKAVRKVPLSRRQKLNLQKAKSLKRRLAKPTVPKKAPGIKSPANTDVLEKTPKDAAKQPNKIQRDRRATRQRRASLRDRSKKLKAGKAPKAKLIPEVKKAGGVLGKLKGAAKIGGALIAPVTGALSAWERSNEGQSTGQIAVGVGSELAGGAGAGALGAKAGALAGLAFGPGAVVASPVLGLLFGGAGAYFGSKYSGQLADQLYTGEKPNPEFFEKQKQMTNEEDNSSFFGDIFDSFFDDVEEPIEKIQQSNKEVTTSQTDLQKANTELKGSIDSLKDNLNSKSSGVSYRQAPSPNIVSDSTQSAPPIPPETFGGASLLRVKDTDGQTKTMDESNFRGQAFEGGFNHPALVAMARLFQSTLGNKLNRFTAFNDRHHHKDPRARNSLHRHGLALDFTIQGGKKEAAEITSMLRALLKENNLPGDIVDEYNFPTDHATKPHIHAEFNTKAEANKFLEVMRKKQVEIEKNKNSEKVQSTVADDRNLDRPPVIVGATPVPIASTGGGSGASAPAEAPTTGAPNLSIPPSLQMSIQN